jgi:hypothetical protein
VTVQPLHPLQAEQLHLAQLLEAVQRCCFHLQASARKLPWPLDGTHLHSHRKDTELFETMAAFNERFAKLQDTLGAAMRHSALLLGEANSPFLRVLSLFEKLGVIESIASWQLGRTARNLAAHDYDTDYTVIAEHFNQLGALRLAMLTTAKRLLHVCSADLGIQPASDDFTAEFLSVLSEAGVAV